MMVTLLYITPIVLGMVFCILGLATYNKEEQRGSALAKAGIVINSLLMLVAVAYSLLFHGYYSFSILLILRVLAIATLVICVAGIVKFNKKEEKGISLAVIGMIICLVVLNIF